MRIFILLLISLLLTGCESKQSKDELVVNNEIEDKRGERWNVNNSNDKFTNEDLSTASIKSEDKFTSNMLNIHTYNL